MNKSIGSDLTSKASFNWKGCAVRDERGFYNLKTPDTADVPVRLFLTPTL
jgi:hypothetical protein